MKKTLVIIIFIILFTTVKLNAYTVTGHDEFYDITINNTKYHLLVNMTSEEKSAGDKVINKSKFWGWKHYYYYIDEPMTYIGEIIFSRINNTSNDVKYNYSIKETKTISKSFNVSDKLSIKGSGGKKINLSLANDLGIDIENTETASVVESLDYSVIVPAHKKVTLYTTGEGKITCGCSANYVFWIRNKKGYWEIVDVKTIYYKLVEEDI